MDEREQRIDDARHGRSERPYYIAFNIGHDDYPVWDNPFEEGTSAYNGYEDGFATNRSQTTRPQDWDADLV